MVAAAAEGEAAGDVVHTAAMAAARIAEMVQGAEGGEPMPASAMRGEREEREARGRAPLHDGRALLEMEQQLWAEVIRCLYLSRKLHTPTNSSDADAEPVPLPDELKLLLPPAPDSGWPQAAPSPLQPAASTWMASFPAIRRAQRFSYLVASLVPEMDRQVLLDARSTRARLEIELTIFTTARQRLAALSALRGSEDSDG